MFYLNYKECEDTEPVKIGTTRRSFILTIRNVKEVAIPHCNIKPLGFILTIRNVKPTVMDKLILRILSFILTIRNVKSSASDIAKVAESAFYLNYKECEGI